MIRNSELITFLTFSRQWVSSREDISCPLHLRDPYEDQQVEVCTSGVSGSGDGLQAKKKLAAGTLVAYYNGVRIKCDDKYLVENSTGYAINLEWDMEHRKNTDVLDILPQVSIFFFYSKRMISFY